MNYKDWETEFEREIALSNTAHDDADIHNEEIKSFIQKHIDAAYEAGKKAGREELISAAYKEIEDEIESLRKHDSGEKEIKAPDLTDNVKEV